MIEYSRFNIFSGIHESENHFIVNLLTGNADILSAAEAEKIIEFRRKPPKIGSDSFIKELISNGYLSDPIEERKLYLKKYLDFIDSRESDEIQLFFITNYSCNFSCSYCYQDQYENPASELTTEIIDIFLDYVKKKFAGRKKYITVFGGEPLLAGPKHKVLIRYLMNEANKENLDLCFVTNGYTLSDYADILVKGSIREIQVTLDGTEEVHNKRRFLKGGGGSFREIVRGIDLCLENNLPVNLRMVTDKENIGNLPGLAQFAIEKGWTKNPLFKTQVGRNYELHHCQSAANMLFDRLSLYQVLYTLIKKHPYITEFYKPAYSISRYLSENGTLPDPLFDSCPACKTEWAFDYTGKIYPCTATAGKADECLGTFYPGQSIDNELIANWERRDVTSIEGCSDCNLRLACGGGCGSVAKNSTGKICSPDCRPVKELLELGFSAYFK